MTLAVLAAMSPTFALASIPCEIEAMQAAAVIDGANHGLSAKPMSLDERFKLTTSKTDSYGAVTAIVQSVLSNLSYKVILNQEGESKNCSVRAVNPSSEDFLSAKCRSSAAGIISSIEKIHAGQMPAVTVVYSERDESGSGPARETAIVKADGSNNTYKVNLVQDRSTGNCDVLSLERY